jgi:NADPH:quinone reductase-like Zn-dependent oxidoreductase
VIDYTREDFARSGERYDVLFDVAGSRSWSDYRRVLKPNATCVVVGAPKGRPLRHIAKMLVAGRLRGSQKAVFFVAKLTKADLQVLAELLASGKVKSVVDRRYDLSDAADAFRYLGEGHAQGKIVVTM